MVQIVNNNEIQVVGTGTTTITAEVAEDANWLAYNEVIAVNVSSAVIYEKITSLSELEVGTEYLIADANDAVISLNTINNGILVTTASNASGGVIANPSDNTIWIIENDGTSFRIKDKESLRYLNYVSSTNLSLVSAVTTNNQKWNIAYNTDHFTVANEADNSRILKYNSGLATPGFKAYTAVTVSPEVSLYKKVSTVWNGTTWSNGLPSSTTNVVIAGLYSTAANPSFTAKNIIIQNGGILDITSGNTITAANVVVEDGGNLIQQDGAVLSYTGTFKVLKNGNSAPDKYTFWSSPVANQDLSTIYGTANTPQFITEYDTATDYFVNASPVTVAGKGYSIKTPAVSNVAFEGIPNTGNQTFTLSTAGNGFNLVGNPYPSNLNLNAFYTENAARIGTTFYFWDNTSGPVTTQSGSTTVNIGYATYNPSTSAWVPAPNVSAVPTGNSANIGQGFIVKTLDASVNTSLVFSNAMREASAGAFFNKNNGAGEGRFWLRLNSSYNTNNTFAVAYINGASDIFDDFDSKAMAIGSDAFYTVADAEKLVIQGKGGFDINDVVPVGAKHFQNGNFTVSLVQKDGIFNNGQSIYLHDKLNNTYTDLQNGSYSFTSNAGEFSDRFEIVYKLNNLSTSEVKKDAFEVFRDGEDFFVRNDRNIEKVEIFDASGRKVQELKAQSNIVKITLEKGIYILRAVSAGKEYTKKLVK